MGSYIAAFTAALLAGILLTPVVRLIALRYGAVDRRGGRHIHAGAIPRLGGLALVGGWCFPLVTFFPLDPFGRQILERASHQVVGLVGGSVALCLVGAADDLRGLRVVYKLLAQVAIASFAYACGFRIEAIALPFVGTLAMGAFALPVTVLWIVGITNAVNLIDGLDGLAAGVCFFAALTGFVVAVVNGSLLVALVLASLMGVLLAFLFFNFNPARIFMGDSGSYFLGYVLAATSLAGAVQQKASTAVTLVVPVLALGLPIFDTLFSMLRRFIERRPIFSADRGHIHHRLLDLGLTHRRAVMLLYGVCLAFAACSITVSLGRSWEAGFALLSASVVVVVLLRYTGYSEYLRLGRSRLPVYDPTTEALRYAIPGVLGSIGRAATEQLALNELYDALKPTGVRSIVMRSTDGSVHCHVGDAPDFRPAALRTSFPIGSNPRGRIELVWGDGCEVLTAPSSILLQLAIDALGNSLRACASPLAPGPESIPPRLSYAPSVTLPSSSRA